MTKLRHNWAVLVIYLLAALMLKSQRIGTAQENSDDAPNTATTLGTRQRDLADKYQQLELLMLKMAEFDANSNPRRSTLLKQALSRSKDNEISGQMLELVNRLQARDFKTATEGQAKVTTELSAILDLLLSENRSDRLKDEQERVRKYIKELERVLRQQRSVQGRTEGGSDSRRLAQDQGNVADRAKQLSDEIKENEQTSEPKSENNAESSPNTSEGQPSEGQPSEGRPSEGQPSEGQPSEGQPSEGQPSEGQPSEGQPSEGQPSEGQPSEGQPSEGQPSEGQPSEGQPQPADPSFPGQQQIQQAEQKMREAQERLEKAENQQAVEPQQKARELLEQAKAQLEEILRQMREEEIERTLAMLEGRFRRMLEMQIRVYEDTQQLAELPREEKTGQLVVQAGKLSQTERVILADTDKALLLLREEGSSIAFPEAVEQMREDIEQVVERLGQAKVDILTIGLEEDIIAALEEIVEALQKAQQEAEQRRQQPTPSQPSSPQDMPLVDAIAELKMIRALQMRVNRRTDTYAKILTDPEHEVGQATDADVVNSLQALAGREERIRQITRDIVLGKNK